MGILHKLCCNGWDCPGFPPPGIEDERSQVMKSMLKSFLRDEHGAAAAEYALILAIVGAGIAIAAGLLGTAISTAINTATSTI